MVTTMRSRDRVAGKRWNQKAERGYPNSICDADQIESLEGHEGSGSGHLATCKPVILFVEISHGDQE